MANELPDAEAALLAATVEAPNTDVPKANQTEFCLSCGAATPQAYCGECGLKNDDLRRSLFRLIAETLGGIFSFEGRMWRTWAALIFKPGKVAREYADGRRTTYSAPIRVYLVVTFLLLFYMGVTQTNLFAIVVSPKTPEQIAAQELAQEKSGTISVQTPFGQSIKDFSKDIVDATNSDDPEALDKAFEELETTELKFDPNNYNFEFLFFQPQSKFDALTDKATAEGFVNELNENEDVIADGSVGDSLDLQKAIRVFLTNPIQFNQQFNIWLPRAMFFMVPMVMFFGVIYIRGPNALLYDHLIHAIYIHSVFFMSLLLAILLSKVLNGQTVAKALFVGLLIYLPISLKRMFGRGWIKTIWTTINIGFIYQVMLIVALVWISVYSLTQIAA
ncbi:MAG: DUF3667 domain-containing protein [Hyphomonadaceae bacterium]|nr:DUF3667 domain-containing protein [Hyphomonadaceae bacterium]